MRLLDESLTAVCSGEIEDLEVVESVFCGMFVACEQLQDVARAEQWLRAADEFVRRRNQVAVGAFCRAHYGGILTAAGRWEEAEAELGEAARMFDGGYEGSQAMVLARLADLRVRQGRLEEAEVLLEGIDQRLDAARPLAALHAARGETALAREAIDRGLADPRMHAGAPARCSRCSSTCAWRRMTWSGRRTRPSAWRRTRRATAAPTSRRARRSPKESCASHADPATPRHASATHCPRSRAPRCRSSWRGRGSSSPVPRPKSSRRSRWRRRRRLEAFDRRRASRDADAAAALLRARRARPQRAERRQPLTKRESEVLELLGHGLSNPEIAERLVISTRTAEHHVGHILSKLDLRNRAEAAAYATRASGANRGRNRGAPRCSGAHPVRGSPSAQTNGRWKR